MAKDKNKGDKDPGRNMRRKPGESGDDLIKKLAGQRQGLQQCGTCHGNLTVKVRGEKALGGGKVRMVETDETCTACNGTGWKGGRTR